MKLTTRSRVMQTITGLLAWGTLALAHGAEAQGFRDYAPVVNVEPILETFHEPVTRETCGDPRGFAPGPHPVASTIGDDVRRQIRLLRSRDSCHRVTEMQEQVRVTGYWVTYRYGGRTSRTRLSYDPGRRMPVDVNLSPLP